jgi:hypothetical protein
MAQWMHDRDTPVAITVYREKGSEITMVALIGENGRVLLFFPSLELCNQKLGAK